MDLWEDGMAEATNVLKAVLSFLELTRYTLSNGL